MSLVFHKKDKAAFNEILEKYSGEQIFLLFDMNTLNDCSFKLQRDFPILGNGKVVPIPPGEEFKNLQCAESFWQSLIEDKANKNTLIINIGGGVVSDLGGFVAANYKRGIDFINIPTSSLAMIDACYGGKTALNLNHHKNQIGCFANPKAIYIDTDLLATLPERHLKNGFIESIKHQLLFNKNALTEIASIQSIKEHCTAAWMERSLQYKIDVVAQDPLDKNERQALNFGHSIGHAIEALAMERNIELYHGEAVLLGMIEELILAEKHLNCPKEIREALIFFKEHFFPKLKTHFSKIELLPYLMHDKKNDKALTFSLIKNVGEPQLFFKLTVQEFLNINALN